MNCWSCGATLTISPLRKISFRETCDKCGHDLHCCLNCKFYKPGRHNDCASPGTEWVAERGKNNFCDEFICSGKQAQSTPKNEKKRFEDLFK